MPGTLITLNFDPIQPVQQIQDSLRGQIFTKSIEHELTPGFQRPILTVLFLGELHGDVRDQAITRAFLNRPPMFRKKIASGATVANKMGVVFERGLKDVYQPLPQIFQGGCEEEAADQSLGPGSALRNDKIVSLIFKLSFHGNRNLVYLVCGSAHAIPIFNVMNGRPSMGTFLFLLKPDADTEQRRLGLSIPMKVG